VTSSGPPSFTPPSFGEVHVSEQLASPEQSSVHACAHVTWQIEPPLHVAVAPAPSVATQLERWSHDRPAISPPPPTPCTWAQAVRVTRGSEQAPPPHVSDVMSHVAVGGHVQTDPLHSNGMDELPPQPAPAIRKSTKTEHATRDLIETP